MTLTRRAALATPAILAAAGAAAQSGPLTLAQIRANGRLRIGCEATYPPFTYRDQGRIVGYDVELAETMCATIGVQGPSDRFDAGARRAALPALQTAARELGRLLGAL